MSPYLLSLPCVPISYLYWFPPSPTSTLCLPISYLYRLSPCPISTVCPLSPISTLCPSCPISTLCPHVLSLPCVFLFPHLYLVSPYLLSLPMSYFLGRCPPQIRSSFSSDPFVHVSFDLVTQFRTFSNAHTIRSGLFLSFSNAHAIRKPFLIIFVRIYCQNQPIFFSVSLYSDLFKAVRVRLCYVF